MSKHDKQYIERFQPKHKADSDTPFLDAVEGFFKRKERHRKHRLGKKRKSSYY